MRKTIGISCITLGLVCLLVAVGIVVYNRYEENAGAQSSQTLLQDVQLRIEENASAPTGAPAPPTPTENDTTPELLPEPTIPQMLTVPVDGGECIGILSIPALELELPVLADWSYEKLKKAPCHYYGSYYGTDFVIAAHNFQSHFGRLSELQAGDVVIFTDVSGTAHCYEVVLLETLQKEATLEMITSGFDLSLYTCTPGGSSRVTVRCKNIRLS